jgi:predicted dehydrogenase
MKSSNFLIAGFGSIGKRHRNILGTLYPYLNLKILKSHNSIVDEEFQNEILLNIEDAILFKPDVTVICSPASTHVFFAQIFADIKSNIFIEKPISTSSDGIKHLIRTCEENRRVLQVGYNLRFSLSLQKFKEIVCSGKLGNLQGIECEAGQYLPDWRPKSDYRLGVSARKELGGGVLLELSHEIDYLRWIFGEVNWVSGKLSTESDLEINVEDTARFKLGFSAIDDLNGLVADVTLDFVRKNPSRFCRVYGSMADLEWNGLTGEVSMLLQNQSRWKKIYSDPNDLSKTYEFEWLSFIDSVNNGSKPLVTAEDGLRVIEIIQAIRIASDTGGRVSVVYDLSISR